MRILSTDSFVEMIYKYSTTPDLRGAIVLRNAERRRELYREINSIIFAEEIKPVRHGCVLSFRNRSLIHLLICANRTKCMYDDILVDETIDDMELLYRLDQAEFANVIPDFGEFIPSSEILEYIGGICGASNRTYATQCDRICCRT